MPKLQHVKSLDRRERLNPLGLFLAGGIPRQQNWQWEIVQFLADRELPVTVFDPRREDYDKLSLLSIGSQISWETEKQREADLIAFWFCAGTDCPVTFYELAVALERGALVVVGVDPEYKYKKEVIQRVNFARPWVVVHEGFENFREKLLQKIETLLETKPQAQTPSLFFERVGANNYEGVVPVSPKYLWELGLIESWEDLDIEEEYFYSILHKDCEYRLKVWGEFAAEPSEGGGDTSRVLGISSCHLDLQTFDERDHCDGLPLWYSLGWGKEPPAWVLEQVEEWVKDREMTLAFSSWLRRQGASEKDLDWAKDKTPRKAWGRSRRIDWLLWFLGRLGYGNTGEQQRKLTIFAVKCAERVKNLIADPRTQRSLEIAQRFAQGEATQEDLDMAYRMASEAHQEAETPSAYQHPSVAGVFPSLYGKSRAAGAVEAACRGGHEGACRASFYSIDTSEYCEDRYGLRADMLRKLITWEEVKKLIPEDGLR